MTAPPIIFDWQGDAMTPASPFMARLADKHFVIGETYQLVEDHARSHKTHGHFFAAINDAWKTLPETMADEYPTVEHLRKKALIRKGYCDERTIVCSSKAEAQRIAAFIKPMDHYAIVTVSEATVRVYTAQSQSKRAMGAKLFQQSKQDVLDFIDALLGVPSGSIKREAGQAA